MKRASTFAVWILTLAMALMLVACSGNGASSDSAPDATADSAAAAGEPVGSPWVTSVLSGNLPAERPEAKDDLYTHYNYDYLAANQGLMTSTIDESTGELQVSITEIIKDASRTGHDLDQLRLFYNQAADAEALRETGLSEVQPYLDRIDAVASLDEMNALLAADDFPFSPFILACITVNGTRGKNVVTVGPNFVLCDAATMGGAYYQESDDPQVQKNMESQLKNLMVYPMIDYMVAGMSQPDAKDAATQVVAFEKEHGKHLDASSTYLKADYGAIADTLRGSFFTLDEMCALAPNFPLKATLDKMGKGKAETYSIDTYWIKAFNGSWPSPKTSSLHTRTLSTTPHGLERNPRRASSRSSTT